MGEEAKEKGQEVKENAENSTLAEKATDAANAVAEQAQKAVNAVSETVSNAIGAAEEKKEEVKEQGQEAKENTQQEETLDHVVKEVKSGHHVESHTFQLNGLPQGISENVRHEVE